MTPREEALKKNKLALLIMVVITIVSAILSIVSELILPNLAVVFLVVSLLGIILIFAGFYERKKIKRSYCPYCGLKYNYEEDVSWIVSNVTTTDKNQKANVHFECGCKNCGKTTEFYQSFTVAFIDNQGNIKENNIKELAKKYFK